MASDNNSSGSSGEQLIAEIGAPAGPRITCKFHDYSGDEPCPWCLEAGSGQRITTAVAFDQSTKSYQLPGAIPWVTACPHCASSDIRRCVALLQDFAWCGQCGARDGQ